MLLLILATLASCTEFESVLENSSVCPSEKGKVGNYTMNLLATFWVGTQCLIYNPGSGNGPVRGTNLVTVHGLWPGNNATSWPECCNNSYPFNADEINGVADLQTNWVSSTGTDAKFYTHEWEKHGTCAMDLFRTERDYFQSTVNLNKRLNLAGILRDAGMLPGTKQFAKVDVANAFKRALGQEVLLECKSVNSKSMLSAIYVCVGHETGLSVQACSRDYITKYASKCPASFQLPPIPDSCYK